jgi:hypothetical protein
MANDSIEISVKGKWVKVLALAVDDKTIVVKGRWIKVASIHDEQWLATELENPEPCVQKLKQQVSPALRADLFTFTQKIPQTAPKYQYAAEQDSVAVARVTSFKQWWENLPQETRKNVRRAQKRGVVVAVTPFGDELIRGIVQLNNDSPLRQGRPNDHYGKSFDQVKKDYSSFLDRSDLLGAYVGSELIGLLKIVYRGNVAAILQCLPKASHNDKRPANALITKAVELCEAKGISYLTYGMFRYGNKRDNPLLEFKIRNGFEEMLIPRFYVPLTRWGAFCLRTKLHRGILGILPPAVISAAVNARAKWYSRKQQSMSRCSSMPERPNCNRQTESSNPPAGSNLQGQTRPSLQE